MNKRESRVRVKKQRRKEIMAKIFEKISGALKEYAIPSSERKKTKKTKKTGKPFLKSHVKSKK
jgi:hypothetical protein